jgi:hypothetical protein
MKRKVILTVGLSILLGFLLGFLVSGVLTRNRLDRIRRMHHPEVFREELFKTLQPNEQQAEKMDSLLIEHLSKARHSRLAARRDMRRHYDSLYQSMDELLDEGQRKKLKRARKIFKMREKHPPPPPR